MHKILNDTKLTMTVYSYIIVSKDHANITVEQNKLALPPFDSKRFILFDGVAFQNKNMDTEFNSYDEADNRSPEIHLPDWRFYSGPTQN